MPAGRGEGFKFGDGFAHKFCMARFSSKDDVLNLIALLGGKHSVLTLFDEDHLGNLVHQLVVSRHIEACRDLLSEVQYYVVRLL